MKNDKVCYDFVFVFKGYKGFDCKEKYNIFGKYNSIEIFLKLFVL